MNNNNFNNPFTPFNGVEDNPNDIEEIDLRDMRFDEAEAQKAQSEARLTARTVEETNEKKADIYHGEFRGEQSVKRKKADKQRTIAVELIDWVKTICIGMIGEDRHIYWVNVFGDSMNPTLSSGDVIFTQKISAYFNMYDRGDILILDASEMEGFDTDEYLIKRVVGMPGETIKISEGKVYIKEKGGDEFYELEESYLAPGTITLMPSTGLAEGYQEMVLGEDEYYCLGDNRSVSNDSRNLGPFSKTRIKAVAVIRVYPFDSIGLV